MIDSHSECIPVGAWLALRAVVPLETCRAPTTRGSPPHPPMLRLAEVGGFLFAGARLGFAVLSSRSLHIPSINPCHSVPAAIISLPDSPPALLTHSFHIPFTFRSHSFHIPSPKLHSVHIPGGPSPRPPLRNHIPALECHSGPAGMTFRRLAGPPLPSEPNARDCSTQRANLI